MNPDFIASLPLAVNPKHCTLLPAVTFTVKEDTIVIGMVDLSRVIRSAKITPSRDSLEH